MKGTLVLLLAIVGLASAGKVQDALDKYCSDKLGDSVARRWPGLGSEDANLEWRCFKKEVMNMNVRERTCVDDNNACTLCYGLPDGFKTGDYINVDDLAKAAGQQPIRCPRTVYEQMVEYCIKERRVLDYFVPRLDRGDCSPGNSGQNSFQWRCYDPASLDYSVMGQCVDDDGKCSLCPGARTLCRGEHASSDAALKNVIRQAVGKEPSCELTLRQKMDNTCLEFAESKKNTRYHARLMTGEDRWACFSTDELDPDLSGDCLDEDGTCKACQGRPKPAPRSCQEIFESVSNPTNGRYWIGLADGTAIQAECVFTQAGGFTAIPCESLSKEGCKTTRQYTDANTCQDKGLEPLILRSKEHYMALREQIGPSVARDALPFVYRLGDPSSFTDCIMRSGGGCSGWQSIDGGKWWLRDEKYSEPNGDYTPGCWLGVWSSTDDRIDFNDANCGYATSSYLCSTNDADVGNIDKTLPGLTAEPAVVPRNTKEDTDVLLDMLDKELGGSAEDQLCKEDPQEHLDRWCARTHDGTHFARFGTGGADDVGTKWRCYSGNELDFNTDGTCINADGECTPCRGAVVRPIKQHIDDDADIRAEAKRLTGTDPVCSVSLQSDLNALCRELTDGKMPYARHSITDRAESVWQCFAARSLDFFVEDRQCVNENGLCSVCYGKPVPDTYTVTFAYHFKILDAIKARGSPFRCSLQDVLDNKCRESTDNPIARFFKRTNEKEGVWRCVAQESLDISKDGLCVTDGGACSPCLGIPDMSKPDGIIPLDDDIKALIKVESGNEFTCNVYWQVGSRWSVTLPINTHQDGNFEPFGWFELLDNGQIDSFWGNGIWNTYTTAPERLRLYIYAFRQNYFVTASEDGTFTSQTTSIEPEVTVSVVNGKIIVGGTEDYEYDIKAPSIVEGPRGEMDGMLFENGQMIRLKNGPTLKRSYTIDAWIKVPTPETNDYHTLIRGLNQHFVLLTPDGVNLGVWDNADNSQFLDSNYDITRLADGWHRFTALGYTSGFTNFYIDGIYVGRSMYAVEDVVRDIGGFDFRQPWGYLADLRVYSRTLSPITISPVTGTKLDRLAIGALGFDVGTRWTWEPELAEPDELFLLENGVVRTSNNVGEWYLESRSTCVVIINGITNRLVMYQPGRYITDVDNEGQTLVRGHIVSRTIEKKGVSNIDLSSYEDEVLIKLWGGGGSGPKGGAGGFAAAVIDPAETDMLRVEIGAMNEFVGLQTQGGSCSGGGRAAVWVDNNNDELLVAGGGGGGRVSKAGAGGGMRGQDAESGCSGSQNLCTIGARGGGQEQGGAAGEADDSDDSFSNVGTSGRRINGGNGVSDDTFQGCPGGNGYFGGGSGAATKENVGSGAGGSGFYDPDRVHDGWLVAGNWDQPGNAIDPDLTKFSAVDEARAVPSTLGKAVIIFDADVIASYKKAAKVNQAFSAGTTWSWQEPKGEQGSLAVFDFNRVELARGSRAVSGTYQITLEGEITLMLPGQPVTFRLDDDLKGFKIPGDAGSAAVVGRLNDNDAVASGNLFDKPGVYTFNVPVGVNQVYVEMYGAGGQGPWAGAGGFASGYIDVISGETITVEVGGMVQHSGSGYAAGGRSAVYLTDRTDELLVAGGGGGSASSKLFRAGAGGGEQGQDAMAGCDDNDQCVDSGAVGGSQTQGGAFGSVKAPSQPSAGYVLKGTSGKRIDGGTGLEDTGRQGGAGGSGYYGGGSGGANLAIYGGGAGGSGYVSSSVSNGMNVAGNYDKPSDVARFIKAAGRPQQPGAVYIQIECPAGYTDFHPTAVTACWPCEKGQYAPAGSIGACSDLVCKPGTIDDDSDPSTECKECASGKYQPNEGSVACIDMITCEPGTGESNMPSPTEGRECSPCELGATYSKEMDGTRKCVPLTECKDDEVEIVAPTLNSDRECSGCDSGTFAFNGQCLKVTDCQSGTYVSKKATLTSDRVCEVCSSGKFSQGTNQEECTSWKTCDSDQYEAKPPSSVSDRVCIDHETCSSNEYEAVAPTSTTDRVCAACSKCPPGHAQISDCTAKQDRVCAACTTCGDDQFEVSPCTESSDRRCDKCRTCNSDEYQAAPCSVRGNTDCKKVTECNDDEYQTVAPTDFSDRQCAKLTVCREDQYESVSPTEKSDRECRPATVCSPGQYALSQATASSDRQCAACAQGTADHDQNPATPCLTCRPGTYAKAGSTACTLCPAGTADVDSDPSTACFDCSLVSAYQPQAGQTRCIATTVCGAGYEEVVAPTAFTDRICARCSDGQTFKSSPGSDTKCQPVTLCNVGEEEVVPPSVTSDRKCSACEQGKYNDDTTPGSKCKAITECGTDAYEVQAPTTTSDRICTLTTQCQKDQFVVVPPTASSDRACEECTICPSGTTETAPCTATTDRRCSGCTQCQAGEFLVEACSATSDAVCKMCSSCGPDQYEVVPCQGRIDRICASVRKCSDEEYQTVAPTSTSNAVCASLTRCSSDEFVSKPATATSNRECTKITTCRDDEYETEAPTPSSDRKCDKTTSCKDGFYEAAAPTRTSNRVCKQITGCEDNEYVTANATETSNTVCRECLTKCPAGFFLNGDCMMYQGPTCDPCPEASECSPGYYLDGTCQGDQSTVCRKCADCAADEFTVVPCSSLSDRVCQKLTSSCAPGTYEARPPTETSDRVCFDISPECSFPSEFEVAPPSDTSDRVCVSVTNCVEGTQYEAIPPTPTSDRRCRAYGPQCDFTTQFELLPPTITSDRVCKSLATCADDEYVDVLPTATSDRICELKARLSNIRVVLAVTFDDYVGNETLREDYSTAQDQVALTPANLLEAILQTLRLPPISASGYLKLELAPGSIVASVSSPYPSILQKLREQAIAGSLSVRLFDETLRIQPFATPEQNSEYFSQTYDYLVKLMEDYDEDEAYELAVKFFYDLGGTWEESMLVDELRVLYEAEHSGSGKDDSTLIIAIGAACGGIGLILIILVVVLIVKRRNSSVSFDQEKYRGDVNFTNPMYSATGDNAIPEPDHMSYSEVDPSVPAQDDDGYLQVTTGQSDLYDGEDDGYIGINQ